MPPPPPPRRTTATEKAPTISLLKAGRKRGAIVWTFESRSEGRTLSEEHFRQRRGPRREGRKEGRKGDDDDDIPWSPIKGEYEERRGAAPQRERLFPILSSPKEREENLFKMEEGLRETAIATRGSRGAGSAQATLPKEGSGLPHDY